MFRGQTDAKWPLTTSLDRALNRFTPPVVDRRSAETFLLREFRQHFYRYSQYVPHNEDVLEWLSLMQHHGAPTRLLDWTYSPYIALYFAIESAKENSECLVWAVNQTDCWDMFKEKLSDDDKSRLEKDDKVPEVVNKVLHSFPVPMLCPLNPFHLNARLTIQQGTCTRTCKQ
jgi:FRG domain